LGTELLCIDHSTCLVVSAFFVPGDKDSVIDVMYPYRPELGETLTHTVWVEDRELRYRIPALEVALAYLGICGDDRAEGGVGRHFTIAYI
jgi:hypothetical protein